MQSHTAKRFALGLMAGWFVTALSAAGAASIGVGAIAVDARFDGKGAFAADSPLAVGDTLQTGPAGTATVLFNDESMLTLGPNGHARIVIYDPGTAGRPGKMLVRIHAGRFRFFPGKILEQGGAQWVLAGQQLMGSSRSGWRPSAREALAPGAPAGGNPSAATDRSPSWVPTTAATDTPATGGGAGPIFKEVPPGKGLVISGAMESGRFVATDSSADPPPARRPAGPAAATTGAVAIPPAAPTPNPPTLTTPAPPAVVPPPAPITPPVPIAPPTAPIAPPAVPVTPPAAPIVPPAPIAPPPAPPPAPPIARPSPGAPSAPIIAR